jgi:hypothetical protein
MEIPLSHPRWRLAAILDETGESPSFRETHILFLFLYDVITAAGSHLGLTKDDPFYYRSYGTPYTSDMLHLHVFVSQQFTTQVYGPDAGETDGKCVGPGKGYAEGTRLIDAREGVL